MRHPPSNDQLRSIRRNFFAGCVVIALFGGTVVGWSATTEVSGAVIAAGTLVVESSVKKIQHPTGGVVAEIKVRNGERVRAGDLLVRLDETTARANLAIIRQSLDELWARRARLVSERDDTDELVLPPQIAARAGDSELRKTLA